MNKRKILSVSEVSSIIQSTLEDNVVLSDLWIRGEISNFKKHTAGHLYFSIKDENSNIRAVMFKSRAWRINFTPQNGMDCLLRGYVSIYPKETMLQLYVEEIIPAGVGLQQLALEELKKKLQKKGYFAPERKRPLPFLPAAIGVITSPVGAAIRDINKVVQRRYPGMPIVLYPALVQGEKAAETIAKGIKELARYKDIDVIIVTRGGGSSEDLSVFNTELIAEVIFNCPKPVISAVGHEVDFSITDLVADVRAATPSMAGELAVPVKAELIEGLNKYKRRFEYLLQSRLEKEKIRLAYLANSGVMKNPQRWLNLYRDDLASYETKLINNMNELVKKKNHSLEVLSEKLQTLSPLAILSRGYSICKAKNGQIIAEMKQVEIDELVQVQLYSGSLECLVTGKGDLCE